MYNILNTIQSPNDLKKLSKQELLLLSEELREYIIEVVSENGGHLASNLGVIELTIALHRIFNSPNDKIIWDVGHQAYAHKILTGRKAQLKTLRKLGGLSGFPKRAESEHDIFETGHSSTSISAALGIAKARDLTGEDYSVIAVIGDGALTGGMAFEALNHAGHFPTNLIVILNDNKMSITNNIGGMAKYLTKLRTEPTYFKMKEELETALKRIPHLGKRLYNVAASIRDWFKYLLVPGVLFEELGFKYLGPIDGHDIESLEDVLLRAKTYNKYPVLIHVVTTKGKGYEKAELEPERFHGINPFYVESGELKSKSMNRSYSKIFGSKLIELAEKNSKIVAVTAAMADGTGLNDFALKFPNRFFDVGIAEQHAVTFCAGLAIGGYRPVFAVYSTFLQRAYDQLLHDVCIQKLPVVFAVDRAGIVGEDGETHQGVFDISYLRALPNMTIMSPKDGKELEDMLQLAISIDAPTAIRYSRGSESIFDIPHVPVIYGKSEVIAEGGDGVIIAEGKMVSTALNVINKLKESGLYFTLINIRFIKPLDKEMLLNTANRFKKLYTIEDQVKNAGMGSSILEFYSQYNKDIQVKIYAYNDEFIPQGSPNELYRLKGMDADSIYHSILNDMGNELV